jgi:hypothetical protein
MLVWYGLGIPPKNQWEIVKNYASPITSFFADQTSNTPGMVERTGRRLNNSFSEAADVFHGEDVNAKRFERMVEDAAK